MKIFAIREISDSKNKDLAYLFYYEKEKKFYIEIPDNVTINEVPLILTSFLKKGERSINSYWSKIWVEQRIIPSDRQNIGQILKDNNLKLYNEYEMLLLANGRCAQDDYYISKVSIEKIPKDVLNRFEKKIEDIIPLENNNILVFFRNGTTFKCDLTSYFEKHEKFSILLRQPSIFFNVKIQVDGYGIMWMDNLFISNLHLYGIGEKISLKIDDFIAFARNNILNANEVAEELDCSRQYVNELVKDGKLHPIKSSDKNTQFLKNEILKRKWN